MSVGINVIIKTEYLQETDKECLFEDEDVVLFDNDITLTDLVCELGLYKSKSQARQANRVGAIPQGWSEFKGNKKTPLFVWNPFL